MSAVWVSVYPYHAARQAPHDEDQCGIALLEWHLDEPHRVPPARLRPGGAQLDEMWHDVKKKRQKLWIWKALDQHTGQPLDWECGRRDKATLKKMVDRLAS